MVIKINLSSNFDDLTFCHLDDCRKVTVTFFIPIVHFFITV